MQDFTLQRIKNYYNVTSRKREDEAMTSGRTKQKVTVHQHRDEVKKSAMKRDEGYSKGDVHRVCKVSWR